MNGLKRFWTSHLAMFFLSTAAVCAGGCSEPSVVSVNGTPPADGAQRKSGSPVPLPSASPPASSPEPSVRPRPVTMRTLAKKLRRGMTMAQVYKKLGKPDKTARMAQTPSRAGSGEWFAYGVDLFRCRDGWLRVDYEGSGKVIGWQGPGIFVGGAAPM